MDPSPKSYPRRIYLDNAKIFRSRVLMLIAARLGFQLIHSRPYRPAGRAKIERFFRHVREAFLARVDFDQVGDLEKLNRLLHGFIEGEYHVRVHRATRETPLDRWVRLSTHIRPLPADIDLNVVFHDETTRRVVKDGTFSLHGRRFEAGPYFIGEKITVRFDPYDMRVVHIRQDEQTETPAYPVDLYANRRVARIPDPEPQARSRSPIPLISLEKLADEMDPDEGEHHG